MDGGDPLEVFEAHRDRVRHVHFKDCDFDVARAVRAQGLGYLAAVRARLFCELGSGAVDFAAITAALTAPVTTAGSSSSRMSFPVTARQSKAHRRAGITCARWECSMRSMQTGAAWKSPLHEMTQTTPTCLWNDSADPR